MNDLEKELAETKRKLQDLKEEYNQYAYVVAHDFSAPFRQINGFANLIHKRHQYGTDPKTLQQLGFIIKATKQCQDMLAAMLQFSRLESSEFSAEEVDCYYLMEQLLIKLEVLIDASNATINYSDLESIAVMMKPDHAYQLFQELLKNALIYRDVSRPLVIDVRAEQLEHKVRFSIQDNGMGVLEKDRSEIFNILRRGVLPEHSAGLGMGLALTKKIISLYDGELSLESEEWVGTSITFTLPKVA